MSKRTNAKSQSGGARSGSSRSAGTRSRAAQARSGTAQTSSPRRTQAGGSNGQSAQAQPNASNGRGTLVKAALGAVGTAAIGVAGAAAAARRTKRPQVLGVSLPKELAPRNLKPAKLAKKVDVGKVVKQIGNAAEQIEAHSDDVRMVSGQVKRLTKKIS